MTTGRINQVTTFRITLAGNKLVPATIKLLSQPGVHQQSCVQCSILTENQRSAVKRPTSLLNVDRIGPPCHQVSHVSDTTSPSLFLRHGIVLLFEDYQQPESSWERCTQSRRISEWLFEDRFSYQQVIHTLRTLQTCFVFQTNSLTPTEPSAQLRSLPSQSIPDDQVCQ